jgi:multidrug efflux pump subunit AcrA (membrane-fusion protein)
MKPHLVILVCLLASLGLSQEGPAVTVGQNQPSPPSVAAWKGTIRTTVERDGTFVPSEASEIKLDLKEYVDTQRRRVTRRLVEILPHGSFVNQGDVIARLDTEGIDKRIRADRMALDSAEMSMRHAEASNRDKLAKAAEALAKSERAAERAAKKLRGYREHEKKFNEEGERLAVQRRQHRLEDQKDELDQLEKMYAEDELVDATEEIVLKRSRRNYAYSVANYELAEKRRNYDKEWYRQWREEDYETEAQNTAASLQRLRDSQQRSREWTAVDMAKRRYDLEQQRQRFADLQRDREQFVLRAPRRGILLHGEADAAPWGRLEKGDTLSNNRVFATVADPNKFQVKTSVHEKDILRLKSGTAAEVVPTAAPKLELVGRLQVEYLPIKGGLFKATVHLGQSDVRLRPGFACKVNVIVEEERDAILIPKTALLDREGGKVVRCAKVEGGPFVERKVVTGLSDGKNIAIRDGLAEGEFVVAPAATPEKKMRR